MNPTAYITGLSVIASIMTSAVVTGYFFGRLKGRIDTIEVRISTVPDIPIYYVRRQDCDQKTSDFCHRIESMQNSLMTALEKMDDKREKAKSDSAQVAAQLSALKATFDQYLKTRQN